MIASTTTIERHQQASLPLSKSSQELKSSHWLNNLKQQKEQKLKAAYGML
jgi:hypothetical protein